MNKRFVFLVCILLLAMLWLSQPFSINAMQPPPEWAESNLEKVEVSVLQALSYSHTTDVVITLSEKANLDAAYLIRDWEERGWYVYNSLRETADRSQKPIIALLEKQGVSYQAFYAGNEIAVFDADAETLALLNGESAVAHIRSPRTIDLDPQDSVLAQSPAYTTDSLAWGIKDTKADAFWVEFGRQGEGVIVANIDTGIQWNHPGLDQAYRCADDPASPACWYDPSDICPGDFPCDNNGHGTHTMGIMVADDDPQLMYQAGMAPGATWIACKGCESNTCSDTALNACADWILAPDGDPANRPHIVNNSWGDVGWDDWYLEKVQTWLAAGIFPAFSAGNSGSQGCSSLGSPGDYQEVFSSANHKQDRLIADTSSRGPSEFGDVPYTKPNISAPGTFICSAVPNSTWTCGYSGTSMASPHSAGAVALLWSCSPDLVGMISDTMDLLQNTAAEAPVGNCGAPPEGEGNYTYGYGYLDVLAAGLQACEGTSLTVSPLELAITMGDGDTPLEKNISLNNLGSESILYEISKKDELGTNVSWLSVEPQSGSLAGYASEQIAITFNNNSLLPGFYSANLIINNSAMPDLIIPVSLKNESLYWIRLFPFFR